MSFCNFISPLNIIFEIFLCNTCRSHLLPLIHTVFIPLKVFSILFLVGIQCPILEYQKSCHSKQPGTYFQRIQIWHRIARNFCAHYKKSFPTPKVITILVYSFFIFLFFNPLGFYLYIIQFMVYFFPLGEQIASKSFLKCSHYLLTS